MDIGYSLMDKEGVATADFDRSTNIDIELLNMMYLIFGHFLLLILNCNIYSEGAEWFEPLR